MTPEQEEKVKKLVGKLDHLLSDNTLPRNVRAALDSVRSALTNPAEPDINVKKNEALSYLEEISDNSNIPVHSRTRLWDVLSDIEAL